ncbi:MAG: hypothetical protein NTX44_05120 [Ignavibacteriales bacterium]|nr:hypothetical protein [Ignavibacteriales bacterium]
MRRIDYHVAMKDDITIKELVGLLKWIINSPIWAYPRTSKFNQLPENIKRHVEIKYHQIDEPKLKKLSGSFYNKDNALTSETDEKQTHARIVP